HQEWPIVLSRDFGKTWTTIPRPPEWEKENIFWHNLDPGDDQLLFVATRRSGTAQLSYWYTYDEGATWELFYGEQAGIQRGAALKKKLAAIFPPEVELNELKNHTLENAVVCPSDPQIIYYIASTRSGYGVRRTLDSGKSWEDLGDKFLLQDVRQVRRHPTDPAAAFCQAHGTYYRTDNYGEHWRPIVPEGARSTVRFAVHPLRPDTLFMGDRAKVWRSDDGGQTWRVIYDNKDNPFLNAIFDPKHENTYHFIHPKITRTTMDDGKTWSERPFK
ncbi:unnamed protein product, partial [marine sediment metagenome]